MTLRGKSNIKKYQLINRKPLVTYSHEISEIHCRKNYLLSYQMNTWHFR